MKTNQLMTVQIGQEHTVQIGHLTQMGSLNDVFAIGNAYRRDNGLREIEMREWLTKENTWEFIIEVERKYGHKFQNPTLGVCLSDYKNQHSKLEYSKLMKLFSVIKSKRGGKTGDRGVWTNLYILFYVLEEFGLNFDISNEYLHEYNLIKNLAIQNHNNSKTVSSKVYVLTDGFFYKIGSATNVQSRINKLQSGNPHTIKEFFSYSVSDSLKLEKSLHKKYAEKRMSGEWFNLTEKDLKEIESLILKSV